MDGTVSEKMELLDSILAAITKKVDEPLSSCETITAAMNHCHALDNTMEKNREALISQASGQSSLLKSAKAQIEDELTSAREKMGSIEADVDGLASRKQKLEEELSNAVAELQNQSKASTQVRQEALSKIPKDKYICSLLKNITSIEWDVKTCQKSSANVKGSVVSKSGIKNFDFDLAEYDDKNIQEAIWAMMKEGERFKMAMD